MRRSALLLPTGQVMMLGLLGRQLYTAAGQPQASWAPTSRRSPASVVRGQDLQGLRNAVQRPVAGEVVRRRVPKRDELPARADHEQRQRSRVLRAERTVTARWASPPVRWSFRPTSTFRRRWTRVRARCKSSPTASRRSGEGHGEVVRRAGRPRPRTGSRLCGDNWVRGVRRQRRRTFRRPDVRRRK